MNSLNRKYNPAERELSSLALAFRKAAKRDLPDITQIFKNSFAGEVTPEEFSAYDKYFAYSVQKDSPQLVVVATSDKKIVGFVALNGLLEDPTSLNLDVIAVDEDLQGRGIGKTLMQLVEKIARDNGYQTITLQMRENNLPVSRFYAGLGYSQSGPITLHYADGTGALPMIKELDYSPNTQKNLAMRPANRNGPV
jgi:ribosomal protein S18 acetylase RimI-like enzyme